MSIMKVNKSGLDTAASNFDAKVTSFGTEVSNTTGILSGIPAHEDFPSLTTKANLIAESLKALETDYGYLSDNITTYISILNELDSEGFDTSTEYLASLNKPVTPITYESPKVVTLQYNPSSNNQGNYTYSYSTGPNGTVVNNGTGVLTTAFGGTDDPTIITNVGNFVETTEGKEITIPTGLGSVFTYMAWQLITAKDSLQYKLKEAAGMNFDDEGFGKIGDRYVIACTTTYGNVGDFIDVYQEDGTIIKCIIGDIKSSADDGCNEWGHMNGQNVIEFVVDKSTWYNCGHPNPGTSSFHPEWDQNIVKIVNKGNYFDLMKAFSEADVITV